MYVFHRISTGTVGRCDILNSDTENKFMKRVWNQVKDYWPSLLRLQNTLTSSLTLNNDGEAPALEL